MYIHIDMCVIVIYLYVCVGYSEPYHNHLIFIQSKSVHLHPPLVEEWVGDLIHQTPRHPLLEMLTTLMKSYVHFLPGKLDQVPRLKQVVCIYVQIYIYIYAYI